MAIWIAGTLALTVTLAMVALAILLVRRPEPADAGQARQRVGGQYYAPMARLLSSTDLERLPQFGMAFGQRSRFQASRRGVYRRYLRDLQADFGALHREARLLLRDSAVDRPDLAVALVKQYCEFQAAVAYTHLCLSANAVGIQAVDPEGLLAPARWLRQQTEMLTSPMPDAA